MRRQATSYPLMPFLSSPVDGLPMIQIHRSGVKMDVCPTSGGVWLDRSELEKVIVILRRAFHEENESFSGKHYAREKSYVDRLLASDCDKIRYDHSQSKYRKLYSNKQYNEGSGISKVMDLFDF